MHNLHILNFISVVLLTCGYAHACVCVQIFLVEHPEVEPSQFLGLCACAHASISMHTCKSLCVCIYICMQACRFMHASTTFCWLSSHKFSFNRALKFLCVCMQACMQNYACLCVYLVTWVSSRWALKRSKSKGGCIYYAIKAYKNTIWGWKKGPP